MLVGIRLREERLEWLHFTFQLKVGDTSILFLSLCLLPLGVTSGKAKSRERLDPT